MKKFSTTFAALILSFISLGQIPSTWYEISSGTIKKLNAIDFPTSQVGYIAGEDSTLLKSIDGGQTWTQLPLTGIQFAVQAYAFTDVDFVDANNGIVTAGYSGVFQTTDGGQTWMQLIGQISNMCFPSALHAFSSTDFFMGGAGCFQGAIIDRFSNGSWSTSTLATEFWDSQQGVLELSFANANVGLAATNSSYILRTTDAGLNWDTVSIAPLTPGFLSSVVMVDELLCYAGYSDNGFGFGILKSVDGGITWEMDGNSGTFYYPAFLSVHASPTGDIYSGAISSISSGGLIFETSDGINWSNTNVDQPINAFASSEQDITFGVGDSGLIIVNVPLSELSLEQNEIMEFQLFPNPVIDELTVVNSEHSDMELQLMDSFGKRIFSRTIHQGETTIECSELSTGIYFIHLNNENQTGIQRFVKH